MVQEEYLISLFNDIKNNVEFDQDVAAIAKILEVLLHIDKKKSFEYLQEIMNNYNIRQMRQDIDFKSLFVTYPLSIYDVLGIDDFLKFMKSLNKEQKEICYEYFFNTYSEQGIITLFQRVIENNRQNEEKLLIDFIMNNDLEFSNLVYNRTELFRRIIKIHLEYKLIDVSFLMGLCDNLSKKDGAVLKTLLLDIL